MQDPIDLTHYPELVRDVIDGAGVPSLDFATPNPELSLLLRDWEAQSGAAGLASTGDPRMAACCRSALWLLCGDLDSSHNLSQSIETREGSYWHGIMHRREGDFGNSKYWFRRVGGHAIDSALGARAAELATASGFESWNTAFADAAWDPYRFVDLCQQAVSRPDPAAARILERIAHVEWHLLFAYCWERAYPG